MLARVQLISIVGEDGSFESIPHQDNGGADHCAPQASPLICQLDDDRFFFTGCLSLSSRFLAETSGSGHLNLVIEDDYLTAQRDVDRSA